MLTSEELNNYRSRDFIKRAKNDFLGTGGQKLASDANLISAKEEDARLEALRKNFADRLSYKKVGRLCDLCTIEYDSVAKLIKLTKKMGKIHRHMGFIGDNGSTLLHPEEALFLIDCCDAEIYVNSSEIGFNEALSLFSVDFSMHSRNYAVYAHLMRAGFIVRRHIENDTQKTCENSTTSSCTTFLDNFEVPAKIPSQMFDENNAYLASESSDEGCKGSSVPSQWNFGKIQFPNDFCRFSIKLREPEKIHLPFSLSNNKNRLFLDYKDFSKSWRKSALMRFQWQYNDQRRCLEKQEFYRPKGWKFHDVRNLKSWQDFKKARKEAPKDKLWRRTPFALKNFPPAAPPIPVQPPCTVDEKSVDLKILYNVHLSDSGFTLSSPTVPLFRLVVVGVDDPPPRNVDLAALGLKSDENIPVKFAVIDCGEILFFDMTKFSTPSLG